jgi:hypothetical protein
MWASEARHMNDASEHEESRECVDVARHALSIE